jgi:hypothetical protein
MVQNHGAESWSRSIELNEGASRNMVRAEVWNKQKPGPDRNMEKKNGSEAWSTIIEQKHGTEA